MRVALLACAESRRPTFPARPLPYPRRRAGGEADRDSRRAGTDPAGAGPGYGC